MTKCKQNIDTDKGIALISVLITLGLLSVISLGFASIIVHEMQISRGQTKSNQAHYLAEAGGQWAIWKLNNDPQWKSAFEAGTLPQGDAGNEKLENFLWTGDEIKIEVKSTDPGEAWINSKVQLADASRKIRLQVYKALGDSGGGAGGGGGDDNGEDNGGSQTDAQRVFFSKSGLDNGSSLLKITKGNLFTNQDIKLTGDASLLVDDEVKVEKDISVCGDCTFQYGQLQEDVDSQEMPSFDFNQAQQNADQVYEHDAFASLLADQSPLTLEGIIYVKGGVHIKPGQSLTINGFLVVDQDQNIKVGPGTLASYLTINSPGPEEPSGLAARRFIVGERGVVDIQGLVYTGYDIYTSISNQIQIKGGALAYFWDLNSQVNSFELKLHKEWRDNGWLAQISPDEGGGGGGDEEDNDSPIVTIKHWEEEY